MFIKVSLPQNIEVLIKNGQAVDFGTPLYKKSVKKTAKIPLAKKLEIKPEKIFFFLKKVVGEEVHKGEVLAVKKSLFGQKKFYSEYDGVLKEINHEDGSLVISTESADTKSVMCFFKGGVKEVAEDHLKLDLKDAKEFALSESSGDFGGANYFFKEDDINKLEAEKIQSKILIVRKIESFNQVRLEVMGVVGFVTLESLSQTPSVNYARIKSTQDWGEIIKANLPYCLVSSNNIYFYQE
ncbi:MAG: hypothetical protein HYT07_00195 [Candidatus Levybacteria bacterium]|nr:hypothetical protein [Candidatus Levybacteria bacterium]